MKNIFVLFILCFTLSIASAQTNGNFQSDPKLVLQEVFNAAKSKDFSKLHLLCPADKSNDGDTQKFICDIASASEPTKNEFITYFKDARITGEVVYSKAANGAELAAIPFWFNHPSGGDRCNETMNLVKKDGKWYLLSF